MLVRAGFEPWLGLGTGLVFWAGGALGAGLGGRVMGGTLVSRAIAAGDSSTRDGATAGLVKTEGPEFCSAGFLLPATVPESPVHGRPGVTVVPVRICPVGALIGLVAVSGLRLTTGEERLDSALGALGADPS